MNQSPESFGVALRGGPGDHFFCYQTNLTARQLVTVS